MLGAILAILILGIGFYAIYYFTLPYVNLEKQTEQSVPQPITAFELDTNSSSFISADEIEAKKKAIELMNRLPTLKERFNLAEYKTHLEQFLPPFRAKYSPREGVTYINCVPDLDITKPETKIHVEGTQGFNGWYRSNVMVRFEATDDCSGVNRIIAYTVRLSVPFKPAVQERAKYWVLSNNATLELTSRLDLWYPRGTIEINYYAIDNNFNIEPIKKSRIRTDQAVPEIEFMNLPRKLEIKQGSFTFTFHASDFHSGVDKILFKPCGKFASFCDAITFENKMDDQYSKLPSMYQTHTVYFQKGQYILVLIAVDYAGNTNERNMWLFVR